MERQWRICKDQRAAPPDPETGCGCRVHPCRSPLDHHPHTQKGRPECPGSGPPFLHRRQDCSVLAVPEKIREVERCISDA